jgi:bifunctional DNA-binding transcriptional regulator/antitoxin component of YhaV-PrlF toxin-antitoxin module
MQEPKKPLREALNLRIDDQLAAEIDRIAKLSDESASETARRLLSYGAEVERRLQAQRLMQHYASEFADDTAGRVVIQAEFVPYTWREAAELREELEAGHHGIERHPRWGDVTP